MRILQLWRAASHNAGGGGMVMRRLHANLNKAGLESRIMSDQPDPEDPSSVKMPAWKLVDSGLRRLTKPTGLNDIHRLSSFHVRHHAEFAAADVVHLHGTHTGFFNYLALPGLTQRKPTVFTLHDMWPLTGHCAFNLDCERWRHGCGKCPYPEAPPAVARDATRLEWWLKERVYRRSNFTVVALTNYHARDAQQGLLRGFPTAVIPNGVDTHVFRPLNKAESRKWLGIPEDRYVVLVVAIGLSSYRKGGDLLSSALLQLPYSTQDRTTLLTVGADAGELGEESRVNHLGLGFVSDLDSLVRAYSAADVAVIPSRAEGLPNVGLEALACGTPIVAFAVGGLPDLVNPGETGLLAVPGSAQDLSRSIYDILCDKAGRSRMERASRELAVEKFSVQNETAAYISLYKELAG